MTVPQMMALDRALAEVNVPEPDPGRWAAPGLGGTQMMRREARRTVRTKRKDASRAAVGAWSRAPGARGRVVGGAHPGPDRSRAGHQVVLPDESAQARGTMGPPVTPLWPRDSGPGFDAPLIVTAKVPPA